ncbi:MAG: PPC domain-containing protein [Pirellulales bacterium]
MQAFGNPRAGVIQHSRAWALLAAMGYCLLALASTAARAELPSIRLDRVTPLGAAAGTTVEVQAIGRDHAGVTGLWFDHPGLRAEVLEKGKYRVTVAADVPEGTYDLRVVGRYGVSNPRQFAVSHGLADVTEKEPNNIPSESQSVGLNSSVHGTSDGNNQDLYRFAAKRGERVTITCEAQRLESEMDASLILADAGGKILASNGDYYGRDPFLDFVVPADGEYDITVHDLSYRGGYPYRLLVTTRPQVENVFPRAIQAGQAVELTALGRNFGSQGQPSGLTQDGLPLEAFRFTFNAPADAQALHSFAFSEHPTDHAVLPTAATLSLNGLQILPPLPGAALRPQCVLLADGPVTLEAEPNDTQMQPQPIALPATVSGRFDKPRDADWFQFETAEDGAYAVEVFSERLAGRADPYIVIVDDKGNRVVELDDFGPRINAFDGHLRDPSGVANLAKDRQYFAMVQDRYGRGGPRYQYVLSLRRPVPDFFVAAIHSDNPGPDATTIWAGGTAYLDLVVQRSEGYNGPITITAEDLPPGMHAAPTTINSDTRGVFVLWADANAAEWTGKIRLKATGERDGSPLVREVRPYTRVWPVANVNSSRPMRELALSIRQTAPYTIAIEPAEISVEAGQAAELKLVVTRLWPDFKEKVRAIPLGFPGNFQMPEIEIPAGQNEVAFKINVQPGTRPGRQTLVLQGQAPVTFDKDTDIPKKGNPLVAAASLPVTIVVTEAKK